VNADQVQARLEEAGMTLLALPAVQIGPRFSVMGWPLVRDSAESYGWNEARVRPALPDAAAIDRMDEALGWVALVRTVAARRVVQARLLIDPVTGNHRFTWRRIGQIVGADYRAVQRWHRSALVEIAEAITTNNRDG
jgi:hypothetical protein